MGDIRRGQIVDNLGGLGVGLLAGVLGLVTLARRPLWMDEAIDVQATDLSWSEYLDWIRSAEMGQALYLLVLKPWVAVAPDAEWAHRLPSVVFFALAAGLLVPLGIRLLGSSFAGIVAGVLLACNAFGVQWSQQARTYTLSMLAAVVVTLLFVRALESDGWGWWIGYGAAAGVAVYAHFFVALVLAAHYPALLLARTSARAVHRWAVAVAAGFLISVPAFNFVLNHDNGQTGWVAPLGGPVVRNVFERLSGDSRVFFLLTCGGLLWLVVRAIADRDERWKRVLVASWAICPVVLCLVMSVFKPLFADRYLIVVLPAACLSVAFVASSLGRLPALAVVAVAVVSMSAGVRDWYRSPVTEDWRAAAAFVERSKGPDDQVLVIPDWMSPIAGYYTILPPDTDRPEGQVTWVLSYYDRRDEVAQVLDEAGYRIVARTEFPSVDAYQAERLPDD